MAELVHSIREIGVLQPDRRAPDPRRPARRGRGRSSSSSWASGAGAPAGGRPRRRSRRSSRTPSDDDLLRDALLENLHRSQLNPLEEAAAYQQLLDDFGCSHEQLATRIGRSRPQISNTLRLLKLPPLVQRRVAAGVLSAGHARALLGMADGAAMERMAQRIVAEGLSVRNVEELVALGEGNDAPKPRRPRAGSRHPQLDDFTTGLSDHLETRVAIALGQRKGKITVEFASMEDLRRILGLMGVPASAETEALHVRLRDATRGAAGEDGTCPRVTRSTRSPTASTAPSAASEVEATSPQGRFAADADRSTDGSSSGRRPGASTSSSSSATRHPARPPRPHRHVSRETSRRRTAPDLPVGAVRLRSWVRTTSPTCAGR